MDANLERLRARFESDPSIAAAFEALEEHHFVNGDWNELVALYEQRLEASDLTPEEHSKERAKIVFRMAQVLEERCLQVDRAAEAYEQVVRLDPSYQPALAQLRRIYTAQARWEVVLQVAEAQAQLPMTSFEQAAFSTEMGEIWYQRLGDTEQGVVCFERALENDPDHAGALLGLARAKEELGDALAARQALERATSNLRGPDRAPALVQLARLLAGPLEDPDRAEELYRQALTDDPCCEAALEALFERAVAAEKWDQASEIQERRFDLAAGARRRAAIALEGGYLHLDRLRNSQGARLWISRALDLFPDDPANHLALADVERLAGNREALAGHLRRACDLAEESIPVEILEAQAALATHDASGRAQALARLGSLHEEHLADFEAAIDAYQRAGTEDPEQPGVSEALERLYRKTESWERLRRHLEDSLERSAGRHSVELHCSLGELLLEQFQDAPAARQSFEAAAAVDPTAPRALQGIERIALDSGDEDTILEAFEREAGVTTDRSRLSFLVWELVRILEERSQLDAALVWIERLVEAMPEDRRAIETCARLQETLDKPILLRDTLERLDVLLQGEEQAANRRHLAELQISAGNPEGAIAAYQGALEAAPDDVSCLRALLPLLEESERLREVVEVRRHLAELGSPEERTEHLHAVGVLFADRLDEAESAIPVFEELSKDPAAPQDVEERLESLLERTERFEALAERLSGRCERLDATSPEARELELRRAEILLDGLGLPVQAAALYRELYEREPECERIREGLERAFRQANDAAGLCELLELRAAEEQNAEARAALDLERATLLEQMLHRDEEAKQLLVALADGETTLAAESERRLDELLERLGEWDTARDRLVAKLGKGSPEDDFELRLRLGTLCQDRLIDPDDAITHLEEAASLRGDSAEVWQALGRLYQEEERPADLLRAIESELETGPDPDRALLLHSRAAELSLEACADPARAGVHYQRVLDLDPCHSIASEFLVEQLDREERYADLARVLETRLLTLRDQRETEGEGASRELDGAGAEISLRIRIAALRSDPLEDLEGAIEILQPAAEESDALAVVAEPLADLYQRAGRDDELIQLCLRAAGACDAPLERSGWHLRIGDALCSREDYAGAAGAYRQALADRPEDRHAPSALRDIYRRLGETEPLVRLLEAELSRTGGEEEIPIRLELATLLEESLSRPEDALPHLRRVLQIEPGHCHALGRAMRLAEQLGQTTEWAELLEIALERTRNPVERARILTRRGRLLVGELSRPEEAVESFRRAIELDATQVEARSALLDLLEKRGDWSAVLECLELERRILDRDDQDGQAEICAKATEIATTHVSGDAALPWLVRLRAIRSEDASVVARIAELHGRAGRHEELLHTLEDEIALGPDPARLFDLQLERALILEEQMASPGRAIAALEAARTANPGSRKVLQELERLYRDTHRPRERVEILELLIADASGEKRLALRLAAAEIYADGAGLPVCAADHLWAALREMPDSGAERIELLRRLGSTFLSLGRRDLWARTAEEELRSLDAGAEVFVERRRQLQLELARAYDAELGRPDAARRHLRALVEGGVAAFDSEDPGVFEEAEAALLRLLRAERNDIELEQRLSRHLARKAAARSSGEEGDECPQAPESQRREADLWLELARLRRERLHRPCRAAEAYREVLARDPKDLRAIRGLRGVSEQVGDYEEMARALEMELDRAPSLSNRERAAICRRLGQVAWEFLDSTTRASRAFAAALEADPSDLVALRSLESLFEAMEHWRGALDLLESEVEVLGNEEPERRRTVWLRAGELARTQTGEPERAARAYEAAAEIEALPAERLRELADLYQQLDRPEPFAEVFAIWCDDPRSGACGDYHLLLAQTLEELDRSDEALARVERALEIEPENPVGWDAAARLREARGDARSAAEALEKAASCLSGGEAARRHHRAAVLTEDLDPEWTAAQLERAVNADPALAVAEAMLARVAFALARPSQAMRAAEVTLELADGGAELDPATLLETALIGGRTARTLERLEAAERLYGTAIDLAPEHPEALAARGELLFSLGDLAGARLALEARLALDVPDLDRPSHLCLVAASFENEAPDVALEHYSDAALLEPGFDQAHEGLVRVLEGLSRTDEAVNALQAWAARASDSGDRAERLLRAGELELRREGREEPAEVLLREATSVSPSAARAWLLLADLLWSRGRSAEALGSTTLALEAIGEVPERAGIALIHARALEKRGDRREAAVSYREAVRIESTCDEGALSGARLLRCLGEWREAADVLNGFVDAHPDGESPDIAPALQQLGRLLAGPLEDVEGAIDVYRRTIAADPELRDARIALAELLAHRPEHWSEAIRQHRDLLLGEPVRLASIRALLRISRGLGSEVGTATGLAILRALGTATPEERIEAPARPPASRDGGPSMSNPVWETARRIATIAAGEIGEALGVGSGPEMRESEPLDSLARFRLAATAAQGELSAPALVPLPTPELASVITLVAELALDASSVSADGDLVNALSSALGRRVRRRVRKALGEVDAATIASIDFEAWRADLRGLASALALESGDVDFRVALTAWLQSGDGEDAGAIPPEADVAQLVATRPEASALLRSVITAWIEAL